VTDSLTFLILNQERGHYGLERKTLDQIYSKVVSVAGRSMTKITYKSPITVQRNQIIFYYTLEKT